MFNEWAAPDHNKSQALIQVYGPSTVKHEQT